MIRCLVVDDQALVRAGFRLILESEDDLVVVGEAADGRAAVSAAAEMRPDVVLMDVRMPHLDGIEATAQIVAAPDPPRVVILTTFDLDEYVFRSLRAGASGFLLKDTPPERLVEAVRVVAAGDALLDPSVTRRLIERFAVAPETTELGVEVGGGGIVGVVVPGLDDLTDREREVLVLMARGRSNAEIAAELFVSETTVKTHVGRILMKLGARDRVQAVVAAYEGGFVTPGSDRSA